MHTSQGSAEPLMSILLLWDTLSCLLIMNLNRIQTYPLIFPDLNAKTGTAIKEETALTKSQSG
jgi:hypothetical protein